MSERNGRAHQLTIYLVKDANATNEDLVKVGNAKAPVQLEIGGAAASLYVRRPTVKTPDWTMLLKQSEQVPLGIFDDSSSTGALLVVRLVDATFLVSFGLGHTLHNPETIARDFGLRVALNSTKATEIRSMDKATSKLTPLNSRTQSSLGVEIEQLFIDPETDLLYAITGISEVEIFGPVVTGRDSLTIKPKLELVRLPRILCKALEQYQTGLPTEYDWVDNIRREKDASVISELDNQLILELNNGTNTKIWLGEPKIVDWETNLGYSFGRDDLVYPVLNLNRFLTYVSAKRRSLSISDLKNQVIHCRDAQHVSFKQWSAYRGIYAEITWRGHTYMLRNGVWYRVADSFVNSINDALSRIPLYNLVLPEFDHHDEEHYNAFVASSITDIELLDRDTVTFGGRYSKIEVCDLIKAGEDLIHVKKYTSSQTLSHLFYQGLVSAETLKKSAEFRGLFNNKLPVGMRLTDPVSELTQDQYQVVYAIYSDKKLPMDLPFFSKITLKNAYQNLRAMGFRVALAGIPISARIQALSVMKPKSSPKQVTAQ